MIGDNRRWSWGYEENRFIGVTQLIREVAQRAGVSVGTVSRVINQHPTVGQELRSRVERAIKELGYQPNVLARGLRGGSTQSLGLIIPDVTNPFFSGLVMEIEQAAQRRGYSVILGNSMESPATERRYVDVLVSRQVDALIIAPSVSTRAIATPPRVPVVAVGRPLDGIASVVMDDRGGAFEAVQYLIGLGHKNIACIAGPRTLSVALERRKGYLAAATPGLRKIGMRPIARIRFAAFDYDSGYRAATDLLTDDPRPTAIFASSDQQAIGALRAARDLDLDVPADVSIIGFDNIPLTNLMSPRMTTVDQPIAALGERSVQAVLDLLQQKTVPTVQRLPTRLVIRESCAPPTSRRRPLATTSL